MRGRTLTAVPQIPPSQPSPSDPCHIQRGYPAPCYVRSAHPVPAQWNPVVNLVPVPVIHALSPSFLPLAGRGSTLLTLRTHLKRQPQQLLVSLNAIVAGMMARKKTRRSWKCVEGEVCGDWGAHTRGGREFPIREAASPHAALLLHHRPLTPFFNPLPALMCVHALLRSRQAVPAARSIYRYIYLQIPASSSLPPSLAASEILQQPHSGRPTARN